jgi:hypothetical protein
MALQTKLGPGLPFWGFVTLTFLRGWIVSPAPNPQPGGPGLRIHDPRRRWPNYTPRHWVPILVTFYDMHGLQWDYSINPGHRTGEWLVYCRSNCMEVFINFLGFLTIKVYTKAIVLPKLNSQIECLSSFSYKRNKVCVVFG